MFARKFIAAAAAYACLHATPALAEQRLNFEPLPQEGAVVRYEKGQPTIDLQGERGAVQLTPLGLDHGRLTFGIAVLNTGDAADHFGVEDIRATVQGREFAVITRDRLDQMARNRAMWTQVAVAVVASAAAYAAATSTDTYSATTYTPRGTYRTVMHVPSAGGQVAAAAYTAGGAYSIASIQNQLDQTRAALADEIVQTTTVDSHDSSGGRFVVDRIRGRNMRWPQDVTITVNFNGEDYPFTFRVTRAR